MRLPDHFDLWVKKAQACPDPERQLDYLLGSLMAQQDWHFYHPGRLVDLTLENQRWLVLFTSLSQAEELTEELGLRTVHDPLPLVTLPAREALPWVLGLATQGIAGLVVNPGDYGFLLPHERMESYFQEWQARAHPQPAGFWIPHLTTEEEDFWQEHGL